MRWAGVVLCSVALTLPIAALSRAHYDPPDADRAVLRFSWRMNVSAREDCRLRSDEELAALPVHMRTPEVCTADVADYTLITRSDELQSDTLPLTRGGAKGDRPLFVLEERSLSPGDHRVRVTLLRTVGSDVETLASFDSVLPLRPAHVQLITMDDTGRLIARSSASPERGH